MSQMSYDKFKRMVERFDEEQAKKYKPTGLKPPKLKVKDTTKTLNANVKDYLYDALVDASRITGKSQRQIIEECLAGGLNKIVHQHTKTVSFWKR